MTDRRNICCREPHTTCCSGTWGQPAKCPINCDGSNLNEITFNGLCADTSYLATWTGGPVGGVHGDMLPEATGELSSMSVSAVLPGYDDFRWVENDMGTIFRYKYIGTGQHCDDSTVWWYLIDHAESLSAFTTKLYKILISDATLTPCLAISYDGTGSATSVTCTTSDEGLVLRWFGGDYDGEVCCIDVNDYAPRIATWVTSLGRGITCSALCADMLGDGHPLQMDDLDDDGYPDTTFDVTATPVNITYETVSKFTWVMQAVLWPCSNEDDHDMYQNASNGDDIGEWMIDAYDVIVINNRDFETLDWMNNEPCNSDDWDEMNCPENFTGEGCIYWSPTNSCVAGGSNCSDDCIEQDCPPLTGDGGGNSRCCYSNGTTVTFEVYDP